MTGGSGLRRSGRHSSSAKKAPALKQKNITAAVADNIKSTVNEISEDGESDKFVEDVQVKSRSVPVSKLNKSLGKDRTDSEDEEDSEAQDAAALRALESCSLIRVPHETAHAHTKSKALKKSA